MPVVAETLSRLHSQNSPFELMVFDNSSSDGTVSELLKYDCVITNVPEGQYVPGRVLNQAMSAATGEFVVFLNSDCIPQHDDWLERLLEGFDSTNVAAVFGRQIPHPDCHILHAKDTEDTYGDGHRQAAFRHCFSMAASAIRRSVWEGMAFNEKLQYSEDIDWTWRARQENYSIRYVAEAVVMHSHNYTLEQSYRRHYGEGKAEATIFHWSGWQRSLLRYSVLPYFRQVLSDWKHCLRAEALITSFYSPLLRLSQALGRRTGFTAGWARRAGI
jgi:rhamnosyltransferase